MEREQLFTKQEDEPEIITESSLYNIVNVSELSTYQCVYNDICTVMDEDNPDEISYYCAYDAKVNAGIDFKQIVIDVEESEGKNIIKVTVPKVEIRSDDITVDIGSLDYMFVDDSANTNTISENAYKACIADVTKKSKEESQIYDLAQQNAENIIRALINPFIEQMSTDDTTYELEICIAEEAAE